MHTFLEAQTEVNFCVSCTPSVSPLPAHDLAVLAGGRDVRSGQVELALSSGREEGQRPVTQAGLPLPDTQRNKTLRERTKKDRICSPNSSPIRSYFYCNWKKRVIVESRSAE